MFKLLNTLIPLYPVPYYLFPLTEILDFVVHFINIFAHKYKQTRYLDCQSLPEPAIVVKCEHFRCLMGFFVGHFLKINKP